MTPFDYQDMLSSEAGMLTSQFKGASVEQIRHEPPEQVTITFMDGSVLVLHAGHDRTRDWIEIEASTSSNESRATGDVHPAAVNADPVALALSKRVQARSRHS